MSPELVLRSVLNRSGVILKSFWDYSGVLSGVLQISSWDLSSIVLGAFWDRSWVVLGKPPSLSLEPPASSLQPPVSYTHLTLPTSDLV